MGFLFAVIMEKIILNVDYTVHFLIAII